MVGTTLIRALAVCVIALAIGRNVAASPVVMLPVPDVRQSRDYTCGPSALQAVLAYWGIDVREDTLAAKCKATEKDGTNRNSIVRVATEYGLKATPLAPMTDAMLKRYLRQGIPVILSIQAWADSPKVDYRHDWDDGHYVVAIGYDAERLYVEDPSILGAKGYLTFAELANRWHDEDAGPEDRYTRLGIVIQGKRPAQMAPVQHVD